MKNATIVIPTYNEASDIEKLISKIVEHTEKVKDWNFDILVVDSSSPDGTSNIVKQLQKKNSHLHLLKTEKEGLGKAYIHGFTFALEHFQPDILFEIDADFSHDPKEIPEMIKKIERGADFVIGSRYRKGGSIPADWGFHRKLFSVLGNLIIRFGFMKLSITDWTSGYRAIKTSVVKSALSYVQNYTGYVFQVALLDHAIKTHADIQEVPINMIDRRYGVSKINSGQYIRNTLLYVLFNSSFIRYLFVGCSGVVIDFGVSFLLIEKVHEHFPVWLATVISSEMAIIWNFILNNYWTFSHKRVKGGTKALLKSLATFNGIAAGSVVIQSGLIELCVHLFGRKLWYVYKVLILGFIVIPYSYVLYNKVVWKGEKK